MSEQKKYTAEQLIAAGGRLWEVFEKNMRRVYFNNLADRIGLSVSYYKTGNVSSASMNGEEISNTSARKIISTLETGKIWYDLNTNQFETKNLGDYADKIIESIENNLNTVSINTNQKNRMDTKYEITSGYIGSMGMTWKIVDEATANDALDRAAEFEKIDRNELVKLLNDGRGAAAKTGKRSPNYYYDHGMEMIRSTNRTEQKTEMVKCSCGHSVPRGSVMSASMGSSCPDCYDRMSE